MAVKPIILQGGMTTDGFSVLGDSNTGLKCKLFTGTTAAAEGGTTTFAHGLTQSKIRGVTALVSNVGGTLVPPSYGTATENQFDFMVTSTDITVNNVGTNSGSILSRPFYVMVWYIE
jgi:hypothetical protein